MAQKITLKGVQHIHRIHASYWNDSKRREEMANYRAVYCHRYWDNKSQSDGLKIETSAAHRMIEGLISAVFSRNPAVKGKQGIRNKGNVELSQSVVNYWLATHAREILEQGSRLGFIFPNAGFKLYPRSMDDEVWDRVALIALAPWELVVDQEAPSWKESRYTGHTYWLPLAQAQEKFPKASSGWCPAQLEAYFDREAWESAVDEEDFQEGSDDPLLSGYVQILEVYYDDEVLYFSPQYDKGDSLISRGPNPIRNHAGKSTCPVVPLYYGSMPEEPLKGYSTIRRAYDQFVEMNEGRTYQARAVRKAARMWIANKSKINGSAIDALEMGRDGTVISVEDTDDVRKLIAPVPHTSVPTEVHNYLSMVQADIDQGTGTAAFVRGEATKATATEVTALAAYTSSEIGHYARIRDAAIEQISKVWLDMLSIYLKEKSEGAADIITLDGQALVVRPEDLSGDFLLFAQESGAAPMARAAKKQEFLELLPVLKDLGFSTDSIRDALIPLFDLPEGLSAAAPVAPVAPDEAATIATVGADGTPEELLNPGQLPDQIENVLPGSANFAR